MKKMVFITVMCCLAYAGCKKDNLSTPASKKSQVTVNHKTNLSENPDSTDLTGGQNPPVYPPNP